MRLLDKAATGVGRVLCRYGGNSFANALERQCDAFHRALNNVDFDMRRNGELRVLEIVSAMRPRCMLDVGANVGEWSRLAATRNPSCRIHAFEIVPSTRVSLVAGTRHLANVVVADHGLSDETGVIAVNTGNHSALATACRIEGMPDHEAYYNRRIDCRVGMACDYLEANGISTVDFVKIDVEGMDLRVIRGFGNRLRNVRAIQFEYGIFNIASHDLLADFCRHLSRHGFVVGKVFPQRVTFFDYHFQRENFHGSNYLAVRGDEQHLIESLGRGRRPSSPARRS